MSDSCKNCQHWQEKVFNNVIEGETIGICRAVPQFWDATEWVKTEKNEDDFTYQTIRRLTIEHKDTLAFVQDGSDYSADLITRSDFYCNQHQLKE